MMRRAHPLTALGRFIRAGLVARNRGLGDLAAALAINSANLSAIMHGQRQVPPAKCAALATFLGTAPDEMRARLALNRLGDADARLVLKYAEAIAPSFRDAEGGPHAQP